MDLIAHWRKQMLQSFLPLTAAISPHLKQANNKINSPQFARQEGLYKNQNARWLMQS